MKNPTIFRYLFNRFALILLSINILFSILLLPLYNDKLIKMIAIQGDTFSQSTIAACSEALYTSDYSFVIAHVRKVISQSPDVSYVSFTSEDGTKINLTSNNWSVEQVEADGSNSLFNDRNPYLIDRVKNTNGEVEFVFSKRISISGLEWGVFSVKLSGTEYEALKASYFTNALVFSFLLLIISLLLLHGSSLKLGQQLRGLSETADKLAEGDLNARAPANAVGEIHVLANALNVMADKLSSRTKELRRLACLVEDTTDAIAILDKNNHIVYVNNSLKSIFSQGDDYFTGITLQLFLDTLNVSPETQQKIEHEFSITGIHDWSTDITVSVPKHQYTHMTLRIERFDIDDIDRGGYFITLTDITQRKRLEHELEVLAYVDKLTKLPNRRYFMDRLTEAIETCDTLNDKLAVFFLDLDNFKIINDSLGHEIGDLVLSESGWRIQNALRSDDIVCRLGGDEFTIILSEVSDKETVTQVASTILKRFQTPFTCNGRELRISVSIGIVLFPDDGASTREIIKNADTAMYAAKNDGKNAYRFFSEKMHNEIRDILDIEGSLRSAIASDSLELVYQPFVAPDSREINQCEALLRWNHPEYGPVPPGKFIPIAEQTNLIGEIGKWVLNRVCQQIRQWQCDIKVSINVSGSELRDGNFVNYLKKTLIEHDVSPHHIQLEFTEHVLVSRDGQYLPILNQLRRLGIDLAIDDFGTGFSSLNYLTELPIDVIKLDKSFIHKIPYDRKMVAVSSTIISLAHELGIMTIGEGVENEEQVNWLKSQNCSLFQGYYFYKPMTASELELLVKQSNLKLIESPRFKQDKL